MVAPKRLFSEQDADTQPSLPTHNGPNGDSYIHKKRRRASSSSKASFLGWNLKSTVGGWFSALTSNKFPAPPASESGTSVSSSSTAMGPTEPEGRANGHGKGRRAGGSPSRAGSSRTQLNGHTEGRPRHLDDMFRLPPVHGKGTVNGDSVAHDDLDKHLAPHEGGTLAMLQEFNQPNHASSSSSRGSPPAEVETVNGKGKARASVSPPAEEPTPTQPGSRSRPILLTSPSRQSATTTTTPMLFAESFSAQQPTSTASSSRSSPPAPPRSVPPPRSPPMQPRLDLSNEGYGRDYSWMSRGKESGRRSSPISVTSSSAPSVQRTRKKKSRINLQNQSSPKAKAEMEKIKRKFVQKHFEDVPEGKEKRRWRRYLDSLMADQIKQKKDKEASFQRRVKEGADGRSELIAQLSISTAGQGKSRPVADPVAQFRKPQQSAFDPRKSLSIARDAKKRHEDQEPYISGVEDLLQQFKIEDEKIEKRIQARLKPQLPTKLTKDQQEVVDKARRNPSFSVIHKDDCVEHRSLERLAPGVWLDDEIMNYYGSLLKARAEKEGKIKLHYFNSFFYQKLETQGYVKAKLARWTKRFNVDIFALDLVIFPVNVGGVHWTAGAIDFKNKQIEYYDSLGDGRELRDDFFEKIREYLQAEHMDKQKKDFDFTGWEDKYNDNSPQQSNGSDCGVFSCQTLENRARGKDLMEGEWEFSSKNMPYFRDLMVWEIASKQLRERW